MSSNGTRMIQFGVFEADLRAGELRRNGSRVKLQEQPLQILTMLLERPGEVVSRDELRTRLWPADTFVDFDHSLNAAVRRLSDALGDSAENPRFVETVARRGYRFLVPVSGMPPAVEAETSDSLRPGLPDLVDCLGGGCPACGRTGCGPFPGPARIGAFPRVPLDRRAPPDRQSQRVSDQQRRPLYDGKYLAFSDNTGFYLRQVDTGETHPLALPDGFRAKPVSWFPDGSHILVTSLAGSSQEPGLWQISALGGSPRKLADQGREAAVSPDGTQIAFLKGTSESQELWLMGADGEHPENSQARPATSSVPRFGLRTESGSRSCGACIGQEPTEYSLRLKFSIWPATSDGRCRQRRGWGRRWPGLEIA